MGGFFSSPSPSPAPVIVQPDAEEEARKARLEAQARVRRGRAGMVATSDRGVLTPAGGAGKNLLGE